MLKYVATLLGVLLLCWNVQAQGPAVSPDGKLVGVAKGATVTIVDAATGKELLAIKSHTDVVTGIAFAPDGKRIASVGKDKKLCLMDVATGRLVATATLGDVATGVEFSADGKTITAKEGNNNEKFDSDSLKKQ
jgi:WD40 repeat protein